MLHRPQRLGLGASRMDAREYERKIGPGCAQPSEEVDAERRLDERDVISAVAVCRGRKVDGLMPEPCDHQLEQLAHFRDGIGYEDSRHVD